MNEAKKCTACGKIKPRDQFYSRHADGRSNKICPRCRDCDNTRIRPRTPARVLRNRARHRAVAELVKRHAAEFRDLLDYFTETTTEEAQQLAVHDDRPETVRTDVSLLRPGKARPGQTVAQRLDVARCPQCIRHHDRGHACTKCGHVPTHALHRQDDGIVDEIAIERRIAGEAVALTSAELKAAVRTMHARGHNSTQISKALRSSGERIAQILRGEQATA